MKFRLPVVAAILFYGVAGSGCSNDSTAPPVSGGPPPGPDTLAVGDITTWAGTGNAGFDGDGHDRLHTEFYWPMDIEFTPTIGVYVSDWNNHRIRKLDSSDRFHTVIGIQIPGDGPYPPETDLVAPGAPGTDCGLNHPTQVLERKSGKLLVVCWHNHKLREWDPATGNIMVLAGRGPGCTGDGLLASDPNVLFSQPPHAVEARDGSLYINDQRNQCIRKIDPSGVVSTVVSTPQCDPNDSNYFPPGSFSGDGGPPTEAMLSQPTGPNPNPPGGGVALDDQGRLYIADSLNHRIRRVDFTANVITTVAGNGVEGYGGDGGDPLQASFDTPLDIAFGPDGRLYIADLYNNRIRAVDFVNNVITTVAGNGKRGYSGDGGPATAAQLNWPYGLGFDAGGDLYIADTYNQRIRRVKMHN